MPDPAPQSVFMHDSDPLVDRVVREVVHLLKRVRADGKSGKFGVSFGAHQGEIRTLTTLIDEKIDLPSLPK